MRYWCLPFGKITETADDPSACLTSHVRIILNLISELWNFNRRLNSSITRVRGAWLLNYRFYSYTVWIYKSLSIAWISHFFCHSIPVSVSLKFDPCLQRICFFNKEFPWDSGGGGGGEGVALKYRKLYSGRLRSAPGSESLFFFFMPVSTEKIPVSWTFYQEQNIA